MTLSHPHIVRTIEHGMTTEDEQFIVMEFLDGPGFNSLIVGRSELLEGPPHEPAFARRPRRSPRCTAPATSIATSARAISSSTKDCESLKLIDFGLTVPATPPFMQPGNRTGTANYMAPEVVRRRPTSQRLDIFAFGVTAYELCAFELPWPRGAGLAAMAHGSQEPTDIRKLCPKIDPRLERAIVACLESDPEKRPATMDEFLKLIKGVERENVA